MLLLYSFIFLLQTLVFVAFDIVKLFKWIAFCNCILEFLLFISLVKFQIILFKTQQCVFFIACDIYKRSDGQYGLKKKPYQIVLCPTQLFQWKLVCTVTQHCLGYNVFNILQFISSLFFPKILRNLHNFFQDAPLVQVHNTHTYIFYMS